MKTKFILPLVVAAAFVACSDDSSSTAPVNPDPALSSDAFPTDLGSSSDMAVIDPTSSSDMILPELSSSSVGGIDPIPPAVDGPYDPTKKYTFYGAELTGKEQFLYGRFEARMKMAATSGSVSSMFLNYDLSWKRATSRGMRLTSRFSARIRPPGSPISLRVRQTPPFRA